ncbi:MAG TPA: SRPBCC domain-containing protein [Candidatus Dormibacteraeota bacterium]
MPSSLSLAIDALTDPGRREVLEQLGEGPRSAAELASRLAAPVPVLAQWLATLQVAGLVAEDRSRPQPLYQVNSKGVEELRDYLERIANLPHAEISGVPVGRHAAPTDPGARFLVRREISMAIDPERAFRLFTDRMGEWWPLGRCHFGAAPPVTVVMEPRAGGRWYERGDDGSESPWGETLVFEPGRRVVLSWQVGPDLRYDPSVRTEVEVRFAPDSAKGCRVQLEHRCLDQLGDEAKRLQATFDAPGGWTDLLYRFVEAV